MTYKLVSFGEFSLVGFEEVEQMGSGSAPSSYQRLPGGGAIDNFGTQQTFTGMVSRNKSLVYSKQSAATLQATINALKKLVGVRDRLYREDQDGNDSYVHSRLIAVGQSRTTEERRGLVQSTQEISLEFETESDVFIGDFVGTWKLNDGNKINDNLDLNSSLLFSITSDPETVQITITDSAELGKTATKSVEMVITAPGGGIASGIRIENQLGQILVYNAAVNAGEKLIINSGNNTITNNGVDAWADLVVTRAEHVHTWFALAVATNDITITGGNGIDLDVRFSEMWI